MNNDEFEKNLAYGRQGELLFTFALQECGCFVTHLAAIQNGGAPRTFGKYSMAIVLPDLQAHWSGRTWAIEVKRKGKASPTRMIGGRLDHGIGLRKYHEYRRYQQRTGLPFLIGIVEDNTGEILAGTLDRLGDPRVYPDDKMDRGGMAFWPRKAFRSFAQIAPPKDLPLFRDVILPPTLPRDDTFTSLGDAAKNVVEGLRPKKD